MILQKGKRESQPMTVSLSNITQSQAQSNHGYQLLLRLSIPYLHSAMAPYRVDEQKM